MDQNAMIAIGVGILAGLAMNFVPTILAYARRHPERRLIGQLNILSIFSFVLWVALIAWAAGGARDDSVIAKFVGEPGHRQKLTGLVIVLVGLGVASTAYALSQGCGVGPIPGFCQ